MYDVQNFDYSIKYLLHLLFRAQLIEIDFSETESIIDGKDRKTMGRIIKIFKNYSSTNENIGDILSSALIERYALVHSCLMNITDRSSIPSEMPLMEKEIRSMRSKIISASISIDPIIRKIASVLEGVSIDNLTSQANNDLITFVKVMQRSEKILENSSLKLKGAFITEDAPVQAEGKIGEFSFCFHGRHGEYIFAVALSPDVDPWDIEDSSQGFCNKGFHFYFPNSRLCLDDAFEIIKSCVLDFTTKRSYEISG